MPFSIADQEAAIGKVMERLQYRAQRNQAFAVRYNEMHAALPPWPDTRTQTYLDEYYAAIATLTPKEISDNALCIRRRDPFTTRDYEVITAHWVDGEKIIAAAAKSGAPLLGSRVLTDPLLRPVPGPIGGGSGGSASD
jgi:hypothetical protein